MNFKRVLSLLLVLVMIFGFVGCSGHYSYDTLKESKVESTTETIHTSVAENFASYSTSGLYELLVDKTNYSIALRDASSMLWYALPTTSNTIGSMLSLEVTDGAYRYVLNSQDNSVAFNEVAMQELDTGVVLNYTFHEKAEDPKLSVTIPLEIKLVDGQFSATVDLNKANLGKCTVLNLSILPTFGAVASPVLGDFLVIPDGCGGLIDLATAGESSFVLDTYGTDTRLEDKSEHPALLGMFGIKSGNTAALGLVKDGDTISKVCANTGAFDCAYMYFDEPSDEQIMSVSYKFISGSAATYGSIASMCREQLTRDGVMSTRAVESKSLVPVCISLDGSARTNFENAEDLAGILKAKGIDALDIRYENALKGTKYNKRLGGKDELESLINYTSSQGFGLYLCTDLTNDAQTLLGLSNRVESILRSMKKVDVPGYCITDAGKELYSSKTASRKEFAVEIFQNAIALSANRSLMVDGGNLYTLKNANMVSSIPMTTSYEQTESYSAIPFIQMILHGSIEYFGDYINTAENDKTSILKSIEYGALPAYYFSFSDNSDYYYDNWTSHVLDTYSKFNDALTELDTAKMTGHKKVQDGLMLTEYNGETFVYVNYTDADIDYNGLTIKAMSFLRVN